MNYEAKLPAKNAPVVEAMRALSAQYPRFGSRRIRVMLAREGIVLGKDRCASLWAKADLHSPVELLRRAPRIAHCIEYGRAKQEVLRYR